MKFERRQEAKVNRANSGPRPPGEDPDIAGIVPGPQPPRDDQILDDDEVKLGFVRLPIPLTTFEDLENGLYGLVLFVSEFPLNARNHVPGPKCFVHFIFLVLQL